MNKTKGLQRARYSHSLRLPPLPMSAHFYPFEHTCSSEVYLLSTPASIHSAAPGVSTMLLLGSWVPCCSAHASTVSAAHAFMNCMGTAIVAQFFFALLLPMSLRTSTGTNRVISHI